MKHTELQVPTFDINLITWKKGSEIWQGIVELSTLGFRCGDNIAGRLYGPLYNDACDVGLTIHNPQTNKTKRFYMSRGGEDFDGEATEFTSLDKTVKVTIIND
jgi:hypothetical protein